MNGHTRTSAELVNSRCFVDSEPCRGICMARQERGTMKCLVHSHPHEHRLACYTENAKQAQQHPGSITTTNPLEDNCKRQWGPNETKPNATKINPRRRHDNPTHSYILSRINQVNTHMAHVYRDAPARTWSSGGRPPGACTHNLPRAPRTFTTCRGRGRHVIHETHITSIGITSESTETQSVESIERVAEGGGGITGGFLVVRRRRRGLKKLEAFFTRSEGAIGTARLRRGSCHRSAQAALRPLDVRSGGHVTALWRGLAT